MSWAAENRAWRERAAKHWSPSSPEPLLLRCWLDSEVAYDGYDPLTVEGSLQCIVILRETGRLPDDVYSECPLGASLEETDIPIPITDEQMDGVPIARTSIGWFSPDALATKRQHWKRARADHYGQDIVRISSAETKTQMVLKQTVTCLHVDFYVHGDRALLLDLLRDVGKIGAARSGGVGHVVGWEAIPTPKEWWFRGPGGRLMRPLPVAACESLSEWDARLASLRAPYWHPRTRVPCGVPTQRLGEPIDPETKTGAAGAFFISPHAVQRFREHYRPGATRSEALGELVRLTSRGRRVGPAKGEKLRELFGPLELWRGPRIGPHSRQDRASRMRFIVGRNEPGLPQVVTVLGARA